MIYLWRSMSGIICLILLNNLAPHNGDDGQPVFIDQDNNGLNDDMIDYFVDEFLDLSDADTTLEKYYELAKFSGRVMDFLNRSHGNYGESYSYQLLGGICSE